jgi:hypothetical protein
MAATPGNRLNEYASCRAFVAGLALLTLKNAVQDCNRREGMT